jgi:hypothetical protein
MQPGPGRNTGTGWSGKKKAPGGGKPVVDPRPGTGRKVPNPGLGMKPVTGRKVPNPGLGTDDKIYRTMPITEKQLGSIKKMYGIK